MISELRRTLSRNLLNFKGWSTNRKIVVFESDDWGSIRMPSVDVYNKFLNKGIPVDKSPYCKYDSLASEEDLNSLFNVLLSVRDYKGNYPVFTANSVVVNPDFKKIKESEYNEYHYETINETFKKYPAHFKSLEIWKQGIKEGIFYPQFHGREHLNINLWLSLLKNNNSIFRFAFENKFWGLSSDVISGMARSIQAAFDAEDNSEIATHKKIIKNGCEIFEDIFGFKSESFIANNFIWDTDLNCTLKESGIKYIQGMKYQKLPIYKYNNRRMIRHYLGEENIYGQYYLIRNCIFEPSQNIIGYDNLSKCLKDISIAFNWNKPAIISTHRLNFVGYLVEENRDKNLELLKKLLKAILKKWPEVEFMTSNELGNIIKGPSEE